VIGTVEAAPRSAGPALRQGVVQVWRGCLDQSPGVRVGLERLLSHDERGRAGRFRFERDRARYVVGRGLLRILLERYSGLDATRLRFRYGRHGKPSLVDGGPFFNVAHSGPVVLYAFSDATEVGVDVELMHLELPGDGVAERFFSRAEVAALRALPEEERSRAFLACWTRKEAVVKACGGGLTLALDSFDVTLSPGEPAALLGTRWSPGEHLRWKLLDLSDPEHGQVAALAAPDTRWQCVVRDIDMTNVVPRLTKEREQE
jgi:4'-phosphopantetheinyl transferase